MEIKLPQPMLHHRKQPQREELENQAKEQKRVHQRKVEREEERNELDFLQA